LGFKNYIFQGMHIMARLKFVQPLSETVKQQLHEIYRSNPSFKTRQRAHALLLSADGYTITQMQAIFHVDRDTLSTWIDRFNKKGIDGLDDLPRSGRPPIYTAEEIAFLKSKISEEDQQIKQAQAALEERTQKSSCTETLKRMLKKH
jgi:transposase